MSSQDLHEKLRKVERLHAQATTPGEKAAAAEAMARLQERLGISPKQKAERIIEYRFVLADEWSKRLFIALLQHHGLQPYRRHGQRRNTILVKTTRRFVDETIWPQFITQSEQLKGCLDAVTERVIADAFPERKRGKA
jgi:hypothetical protein